MAGFTPGPYIEFTDEGTAGNYALRAGTPTKSLYYPTVIAMCHRIPWWQRSPGDCNQGGKNNPSAGFPGGALKITGLEGSVAGATAGIAGVAAGGATVGTAASVASAATLASGIGAAIGLVLLPFALIGAHHAQAVAKETAVGCQVAVAWNSYMDQIEQGLKMGAMSQNDVLASLQPALDQINGAINQIAVKAGDAGDLMRYGLKATAMILRETLIPKWAANASPLASLECNKKYWEMYHDVRDSGGDFSPINPLGAWNHYNLYGKKEGRVWPCSNTIKGSHIAAIGGLAALAIGAKILLFR